MRRIIFRHYLGVLLLAGSPAAIGSQAADAIANCARIASTGDRIICLEDALRRLAPTAARPAVADEAVVAAEPVPTEAERTHAAAVAVVDDEVLVAAESVAAEVTAPATSSEPAPQRQRTTNGAALPEVAGLGQEQLKADNDEKPARERMQAMIVEYRLVGSGRLRLALDNGQTWQQTGDDDDRIARKLRHRDDIAVEMWRSRSGGYRMYIVPIDRTLRVRRIR